MDTRMGNGYESAGSRMVQADRFMCALWVSVITFVCAVLLGGTVFAAPLLKMGAEGHDVDVLQNNLRDIGYEIERTGVFDEATYRAVIAFQRDEKLEATGMVDRMTWKTLRQRADGGGKAPSKDARARGAEPQGKDAEVSAKRVIPPDKDATWGRVRPSDPGTTEERMEPPGRDEAAERVKTGKRNLPEDGTNDAGQKRQSRGGKKKEPREESVLPSASVPESAAFLPKAKAEAIIRTAKKYMGTRYQFGGTTPKGFDCSGFLQYVFRQHGFSIARTADEQYKLGKRVRKRAELVPGDLVFFSTYEKGASHCGIFLGKDQFIHVSSSRGVRIDSLDNEYWKPRWYGGKHIVK